MPKRYQLPTFPKSRERRQSPTTVPGISRKESLPDWITSEPAEWAYSSAEWWCQWALLAVGFKEHEDFVHLFEIPELGPNAQPVDFYIVNQRLILRVQGIHFHYELGLEQIIHDQIEKDILQDLNFTVIDLDEDDLEENPLEVVKLAVFEGRDVSRAARGESKE